ncbi:hypothetical protein ACFX2B_008031 [Malus domestica]
MPLLLLPRTLIFLYLKLKITKRPMATMGTTTAQPPRARFQGVVFDMDETLTVPVIDFAAMYRVVLGEDEYIRIKAENPSGIDILHHIENWIPEKQQNAYDIITDFERQGNDRLQIMLVAHNIFNYFTLFCYPPLLQNRGRPAWSPTGIPGKVLYAASLRFPGGGTDC